MRKWTVDDTVFDELTSDGAYWLGFLAADGYICDTKRRRKVSLKLAEKDLSQIERWKHFVGSDAPIVYDEGYPKLTVSSSRLVEQISRYIPVGPKSLRTDLPDIGLLTGDYIRGYFDGDGWISKRKDSGYEVGIVSRGPIIYSLNRLFQESNMTTRIRVDGRSNAVSVLFGHKDSIKIFYDLCNGTSSLRLERKWAGLDSLLREKNVHQVRSETKSASLAMLRDGYSYESIVEKTGAKVETLYSWKYREGIIR